MNPLYTYVRTIPLSLRLLMFRRACQLAAWLARLFVCPFARTYTRTCYEFMLTIWQTYGICYYQKSGLTIQTVPLEGNSSYRYARTRVLGTSARSDIGSRQLCMCVCLGTKTIGISFVTCTVRRRPFIIPFHIVLQLAYQVRTCARNKKGKIKKEQNVCVIRETVTRWRETRQSSYDSKRNEVFQINPSQDKYVPLDKCWECKIKSLARLGMQYSNVSPSVQSCAHISQDKFCTDLQKVYSQSVRTCCHQSVSQSVSQQPIICRYLSLIHI